MEKYIPDQLEGVAVSKFLYVLYDCCQDHSPNIDTCRFQLILTARKSLDVLPATNDVLELHIKRAHYQAKILLNATDKEFQPDDPLDIGAWKLEENSLKPNLVAVKPSVEQHDVSTIDLTKDAYRTITHMEASKTGHLQMAIQCGRDAGYYGNDEEFEIVGDHRLYEYDGLRIYLVLLTLTTSVVNTNIIIPLDDDTDANADSDRAGQNYTISDIVNTLQDWHMMVHCRAEHGHIFFFDGSNVTTGGSAFSRRIARVRGKAGGRHCLGTRRLPVSRHRGLHAQRARACQPLRAWINMTLARLSVSPGMEKTRAKYSIVNLHRLKRIS
ncbi:hypothetical protein DPMN_010458 [Dreissena polymorpha]|uniref:Uncharacterized protein n=1 Tax=Dreissena polymorpha TaxID=45954 RepID=A0A9D4N269_DREPO|nr:hypothetical protein DPMN_010458 [Dreissena polymorpha]